MNKLFAGFGFILVFAGLITLAIANIKYYDWTPPKSVQSAYDSWTVTADFLEGERLFVNIVPNLKWSEITEPGDPNGPYPYGYNDIFLEIIDPYGNKTKFKYTWMKMPNPKDPQYYVFLPENLTVIQNGSLINPGFIGEEGEGEPGGTVKYNGTYTANITGMMSPFHYPRYPPKVIELVQSTQVFVQPYFYVFPVGAGSFVGGMAASIYAITYKETKRKKKH
jgi:hypothetical protein